jgi:hypothetical protein
MLIQLMFGIEGLIALAKSKTSMGSQQAAVGANIKRLDIIGTHKGFNINGFTVAMGETGIVNATIHIEMSPLYLQMGPKSPHGQIPR